MASLLLLIKTRRLSRRERDTVLRRVRVAINRRVIAQIDGSILRDVSKSRRLRDGNGTRYATARNEIRDVLRRDNFVAKINVNLIVKNH